MDTMLHHKPLPEALRYIGQLGQCARIDRLAYEDGLQGGSRLLRLNTGGGLTLDVHPDRVLDIGQVGGIWQASGMAVADADYPPCIL